MQTYLITGTRQGIGLETVRQLSTSAENTVFAVVRSLEGDLRDLKAIVESAECKASIFILEADLGSAESIAALTSQLPSETRLDYVIQNASIILQEDRKSTTLTLSPRILEETFRTNVVGSLLLLQALQPRLAQGARLVNMSSGQASGTKVQAGRIPPGPPAYAVSKGALNTLTLFAAKHLAGKAIVVALDPGGVRTKMGGSHAALDVDTSVEGILKVVHGLKEEDSGKWFLYDGSIMPW